MPIGQGIIEIVPSEGHLYPGKQTLQAINVLSVITELSAINAPVLSL